MFKSIRFCQLLFLFFCTGSFSLPKASSMRGKLVDPQLATLHQTVATAGSHLMCHQITFAIKSKLPPNLISQQTKIATKSNLSPNQICHHCRFTFDVPPNHICHQIKFATKSNLSPNQICRTAGSHLTLAPNQMRHFASLRHNSSNN